MNNYIIKALFLVLTICSFFSCKDALNLRPPDSVTNNNFWNTPKDFKLATNHYYEGLPGPEDDAGGYLDEDSDIQYGAGRNTISSGDLVSSANDNFWDERYSMLREINTLLQEASEYENPEEIKTSVAEAKFFRAFEYFRLVRRYGDVPYYEKPLRTSSDEELFKSRTPRATVIKNVLADLDAAIPDLPLESETSGPDQGRVTSGAALALKAQVALFEGTWVKYHNTEGNVNELLDITINAANKVVNSNEYGLFVYEPDPTQSYKFSYTIYANDSKEQVFAKRYDREIQPNGFERTFCCAGSHYGTKKLADLYVATDGLPIDQSPLFQGYGTMVSEYQNRDLRMPNTLNVPGTHNPDTQELDPDPDYPSLDQGTGYEATKFIYQYEGVDFDTGYDFNFIIKYPLVLLTLAEALYERNGAISDDDLNRTINLLRDRAHVRHLTNAFVESNNLDMLEEIRRERTVELAWDGFRLNDLRRWNTAVDELGQAVKGVNLGSGAWDDQYDAEEIDKYRVDENGFKIQQPASDRNFSERHYLFPIPTQQIQLNPQLTQNPGY